MQKVLASVDLGPFAVLYTIVEAKLISIVLQKEVQAAERGFESQKQTSVPPKVVFIGMQT